MLFTSFKSVSQHSSAQSSSRHPPGHHGCDRETGLRRGAAHTDKRERERKNQTSQTSRRGGSCPGEPGQWAALLVLPAWRQRHRSGPSRGCRGRAVEEHSLSIFCCNGQVVRACVIQNGGGQFKAWKYPMLPWWQSMKPLDFGEAALELMSATTTKPNLLICGLSRDWYSAKAYGDLSSVNHTGM